MYQFNDTIRGTPERSSGLGVTFAGVSLNDELNNADGEFFVANVAGRDALDREHSTADVTGRDGKYFYGATYGTREIKIVALVTGKSDAGMRKQFERLNRLLRASEAKPLVFADEPEREYRAVFSKLKEHEQETSNNVVVTLEFICYDPLKYSTLKSTQASRIDYQGDLPSLPKLTLRTTAGAEIRILHVESGQYVRLKATYINGSNLVVDNDKRTITLNDRNELGNFDMVNSRFFKLTKGINTLQVTGATLVKTEYREVFA